MLFKLHPEKNHLQLKSSFFLFYQTTLFITMKNIIDEAKEYEKLIKIFHSFDRIELRTTTSTQ